MSNISISDLSVTGFELFTDSESFLNELTNDKLNIINGGIKEFPINNVPPTQPGFISCILPAPSFVAPTVPAPNPLGM
jgi:hypothetical protein